MEFCRKRIGLYFSTSENAKLETGKKKNSITSPLLSNMKDQNRKTKILPPVYRNISLWLS
jgi:hypothetical protein